VNTLKNNKQAATYSTDESKESLGLLLWKTSLTWQRMIKRTLDSYDLSHPQFVILQILLETYETQEKNTQISIVRHSKLDKMTVSKSLKKLGSLGLTARHENENDPRAKTVLLTEKGKKIIDVLKPTIERIDKGFFNALTIKQQEELKYTLTLLKD
jgi:MarR family transcriptional regulator, organic hydroperoxide resistance regulator